MKKTTLLSICIALATFTIYAADAPITATQAAKQARENLMLARHFWARGLAVCDSTNVSTRLTQGYAIAAQANQRARETLWDTQANKARIPYAGCSAMLADAAVLARACTEEPEPEDSQ